MQRRLVIASGDPRELAQLRQMLTRSGYRVVAEAQNGMEALQAIRATLPEVVVLDDRLPVLDGMQVAKIITEENLAPAVLMVSVGNKGLVERARDVTAAFLMRPFLEDQVYAAVEVAASSYKRFNQLQQQLNELQEKLKARKTIEKAKGILMKRRGLSEEQAYKAMQQTAMKKRTTMQAVAKAIITAYEMGV
ncbi:response regulator receiver and ANTAR domain protein [Desulfotomaculum nigrificans CO-1-SRB]|uniref:Stage 0 sporulation protein A homolog n=1 Tax=Desulfotomaculum nigrificans (strain DSM 14880 / VKM B-2319 / CO-1-SRB) TaxID=868595 RepID=F6B7D4_DESCC|nr:ANTAR domain-containing protein [Desulfotomaculum nigrificans]AEF93384.1 response regulator receiver and ANTAR domain protein [Desulfotomaculum nigrificans CO-1-SRB]